MTKRLVLTVDSTLEKDALLKQLQDAEAAQSAIAQGLNKLSLEFAQRILDFVYAELAIRPIRVRLAGGNRKGSKLKRFPCPLCRGNPNRRRKWGYICRKCWGAKKSPYRRDEMVAVSKLLPPKKPKRIKNREAVAAYEERKRQRMAKDAVRRNRDQSRKRMARLRDALGDPDITDFAPAQDDFLDTVTNIASNPAPESNKANPEAPRKAKDWNIFE